MNLFLHIGYPKTATTWLQRTIFPRHPDIGLIGVKQKYSDWGTHLVAAHDLEFDAKFVRDAFMDYAQKLNKPNIVLSWEHLLGDTAYGGDLQIRHMNRLYQCFPEAKVIIIIREQRSMIRSIYKQYVQEGGTWSCQGFLRSTYPYRVHLSLVYLDYAQVIAQYAALFGEQQIYVGTFEQIKTEPSRAVRKLMDWMDLSPDAYLPIGHTMQQNVSLSLPSIHLLRLLNTVLPSRFNGRGPVPYSRTPIIRVLVRAILQRYFDPYLMRPILKAIGYQENLPLFDESTMHDAFAQGNSMLVDFYQLPLAEHHYLIE